MPERGATARPEFEVLSRCARKELRETDKDRLEGLFRRSLDYPYLLRLADQHGVLPLLYKHLSDFSASDVPPKYRAQLHEDARRNVFRSLFLSGELLRVMEVLGERAIPAAAYKGPILAVRAYGDPGLRQFADLDVVVPQKHMPCVFEAMRSLDYRPILAQAAVSPGDRRMIPGEYAFLHRASRARVEIHTEFTLRHFPVPPDLEPMLRRSGKLMLDGKAAAAFSLEDDLLLLVVHGAKDFWARLIWIADVAELAGQLHGEDWRALVERARQLRLTRMLWLALALGERILSLALPSEIEREVAGDLIAQRLAQELCDQLVESRDRSEGIFWRSGYRIRMAEGLPQGIRYWLRLSTAPSDEDWPSAGSDGPQAFSRGYAFRRPLRLWKKYRSGPLGAPFGR